MKFSQTLLWSIFGISTLIYSALAEEGAVQDKSLDAKLRELEKSIQEVGAREIFFLEKRYFPFRRKPVELQGTLRMLNNYGVSISYPNKRTLVIADAKGTILRKFGENGSFAERKGGMEESSTIRLLKAAFEFDRSELAKLFEMNWNQEGDVWFILMKPLDRGENRIESVTVSGKLSSVEEITLSFSENKRIEISVLNEVLKSGFTEEEKVSYFRGADD